MLPGNLCLRWIPPQYQLGGATLIFATLICIMSAASSYVSVLVLRILIGVAQAFVQGIPLYMSLWYTRREVTFRAALYFSAATLSGAFSGLIAYGIGKDLTLAATGREPWQWFLVVVGSVVLAIGAFLVIALPTYPDKMKTERVGYSQLRRSRLAIRRTASEYVQT